MGNRPRNLAGRRAGSASCESDGHPDRCPGCSHSVVSRCSSGSVLAASTYPNEVSDADQWLKANSNLQGQALVDAVNQQQWDPSVQALTQFPSVLDNMANNLSWTSALGSAFYNQQADVMASVQRLRAQAQAAGNLKSTPQMTVVQQDPQTIVIQPASPTVVYVPTYNPTVVYGTPYYPPGYSTGALVATSILSFGVGIAVGAAMSGGCCGWGWNNWNCGWRGGTVVYNRNVYVSRSNIYAGGNRYYNGNWAGQRRITRITTAITTTETITTGPRLIKTTSTSITLTGITLTTITSIGTT